MAVSIVSRLWRCAFAAHYLRFGAARRLEDVLDELVLLPIKDVSEVGALLSAALHGGLEVEPGGGEPVPAGVVEVPVFLAGRVRRHQPSSNINSCAIGDSCLGRRQGTELRRVAVARICLSDIFFWDLEFLFCSVGSLLLNQLCHVYMLDDPRVWSLEDSVCNW